jgi:glycosyltransferase involved in cell wall biosynthesis
MSTPPCRPTGETTRKPRPSVLHVAQPTDGGVGRYVAAVAADQRDRGWAVTVACPPDGWLPRALAEAGVPSLAWPAAREPGSASTAEVLRLRGLVAAVRPDVVHLHSSKAGLAGRLAVRGRRRTFFQPHGWSWLAATGSVAAATLRWERMATRWTDLLVCVGDGEAAAGREARLRAPYAVVRNGVDLTAFAPADRAAARAGLGLPATAPIVVCVGRVTRQKGQDQLLAAWPAVTASRPDAVLVLVGGGDQLADLRAAAPAGVVFAGDVADTRPWYAAADLVVQPSRWEGLPLTLLEALASGRPVVATAVPGIADVLPADATVPAGDTAALAAAIGARLTDPARLATEGLRASRYARGYDLRVTLSELAALTAGPSADRPGLPLERLVPAQRGVGP